MKRPADFKLRTQFFRSYFLLLVLPLATGCIIYARTSGLLSQVLVKHNEQALARIQESLDSSYSAAAELSNRIAYNSTIVRLLDLGPGPMRSDIYKIRSAQQELARYVFSDDSVRNVFVWFSDSDILLTLKTTYLRAGRFYDSFFSFGDESYSSWTESLLSQRYNHRFLAETVLRDSDSVRTVIPFVQSIPLNSPSENKGAIVVIYDAASFSRRLASTVEGHVGWSYIVDPYGALIAAYSSEWQHEMTPVRYPNGIGTRMITIDGEKVIASVNTSDRTGDQIVSVIPRSALLTQVTEVRVLMSLSALATLVVGFLTALLLASQKSVPLQHLIETAHIDVLPRTYSKVVKAAEDRIAYLKGDVDRMQRSMREYMPYVRASSLNRLISGGFASEDEIDLALTQAEIDLAGSLFTVVLLRIPREQSDLTRDTFKRLGFRKSVLSGIISSRLGPDAMTHDSEVDSLIVVVRSADADPNRLRVRLESEFRRVREIAGARGVGPYRCTAGRIRTELESVHSSYFEARSLADSGWIPISDDVIEWYEDHERTVSVYYSYPLEEEQRMIGAVKSGNYAAVTRALDSLFRQNSAATGPGDGSRGLPTIFFYEMKATFIRCAREIAFDLDRTITARIMNMAPVTGADNAVRVLNELKAAYRRLCDHVESRKTSHNAELASRIRTHIESHFQDNQMSLASIAEAYNMSETYFSHFFKEQTGHNFHSYLEQLRTAEARHQLMRGLPVDRVAANVGYGSTNTFRRAFKRRFGVSPSRVRADPHVASDARRS